MMRFVGSHCTFSPRSWGLVGRQSPLESNLQVANSRASTFTAKLAAEWRGRCSRLPRCIIIMKEQQRDSKWVKVRAHETDVCAWEVAEEEGWLRKCGGVGEDVHKMQTIAWALKEMLDLCSWQLLKHAGVKDIKQDIFCSRIASCHDSRCVVHAQSGRSYKIDISFFRF